MALSNLIKALQIFAKYGDPAYPTHCEHDVLRVCIDPNIVSEEDKIALDELGFFVSEEEPDCFMSFRYGAA